MIIKMARSHITVALVATTSALLIISSLLSQFGFPRFQYYHWTFESVSNYRVRQQIPINPLNSGSVISDDGTQYLLGVGKADITGYRQEIASGQPILMVGYQTSC